jgi:hypothetical protein
LDTPRSETGRSGFVASQSGALNSWALFDFPGGMAMAKGKAFVVVGHKNWGKSLTLKALTNGDHNERTIKLNGNKFFIRRMSNDDVPLSFLKFIEKLDPLSKSHVILTLCPDFEIDATIKILDKLNEKYRLFFWVIENQYGRGRQITDAEIKRLKQYGEVEVFKERDAESNRRAKRFRRFIQDRL